MKRTLFVICSLAALLGYVTWLGAQSVNYTTYLYNAAVYTNVTAKAGVFTNGITAGASTFTGAVGVNNGTLTGASTPVLDLAQTWNNAGTTFTGLKLNITNSNSGGLSKLLDLQIGAVSKVSASVAGLLSAEGVTGNNGSWYLAFQRASLAANVPLTWTSSDDNASLTRDTYLYRDAANTLAQRNGTNAQAWRVYNKWENSGTDYERGFADWTTTANTFTIGAIGGGTGLQRPVTLTSGGITRINGATLSLQVGGATKWNLDTSGNLLATADNTIDIGASGATRPRNVYVAGTTTTEYLVGSTYVQINTGGSYRIAGKGIYTSPANGVLLLQNSSSDDFSRIDFGGTTTNYPALTSRTNVAGMPYLAVTDATGANYRKIVTSGSQGGHTKVLTDATVTSVFWITVPNTNVIGGKVFYEISATDGTDTQGISGDCKFVGVAKSGTVTAQVADVQTTAAASAGTLTCAVAANVATNNVLALTFNADTSLTTTNLVIKYRVESPNIFDTNPL